jgi:hypothetical protein
MLKNTQYEVNLQIISSLKNNIEYQKNANSFIILETFRAKIRHDRQTVIPPVDLGTLGGVGRKSSWEVT